MKKEWLVKTLALGIVVLFIGTGIVSAFNVVVDDEIEFPEENGPYKFFITNHIPCNGHGLITLNLSKYFNIGPFCYTFENNFSWYFLVFSDTILIVNGENHKINSDSWWPTIRMDIYGLKGYCPGLFRTSTKFLWFARFISFGTCSAIDIIS